MPRRYKLKRRADGQSETRRRIVEAAVTLHGSVGMARTTVTQVAELAGVGRQTVYRHFPDEPALVQACSGLYWSRNPLPDPEPWKEVADPAERVRIALVDTYAYHRQTEAMISRAIADAGDSPVMQPYHDHWNRAADVVAAGWRAGRRRGSLLRAAIGHALAFTTWYSLVRDQGLTDRQAVELMHRLIVAGLAS